MPDLRQRVVLGEDPDGAVPRRVEVLRAHFGAHGGVQPVGGTLRRDPVGCQVAHDDVGGVVLPEGGLRVLVQVVQDGGQLALLGIDGALQGVDDGRGGAVVRGEVVLGGLPTPCGASLEDLQVRM